MTVTQEPFGNDGPLSKIERVWHSADQPMSYVRRRVTRFDHIASLQYSPVEYVLQPFQLETEGVPDVDWTKNAFETFVRGEFGVVGHRTVGPELLLDDVPVSYVGLDFLDDFVARSERKIYDASLRVIDDARDNSSMARAIFSLLCTATFGSRHNAKHNTVDEFVTAVVPRLENRDRLTLVLPGFPFKDQNRFRVPYGPRNVDLGELSLLIRLHVLTQAIYQVHPHGADVVILSDGTCYSDIFKIPQTDTEAYFSRLISYRNLLNLQGTVSIIKLQDLLDRTPLVEGTPFASRLITAIGEQLETLVKDGREPLRGYFTLVDAMKWNMNTRSQDWDLSRESWMTLVGCPRSDAPPGLVGIWDEFDVAARAAAIRYAATNIAIRRMDLVSQVFPGSIRGTVHPKPGQFCLTRDDSSYPWNGVARVTDADAGADGVSTVAFDSLRAVEGLRQYRLGFNDEVLFFTGRGRK